MIVAVDSSGTVNDPPINMVAVRLKTKKNNEVEQKHCILYMSVRVHDEYKKRMDANWRLKLSAALMFKTMETLVKPGDVIFIDKDFTGIRKERVEKYLKKLFGKFYYGTPLNNPTIRFITREDSIDIKTADIKSKKARHRELPRRDCPNLWDCIDCLG